MLPYYLVTLPLWLLFAILLPGAQSLHALRIGTIAERKLWLFYWVCFAVGSWVSYWFEWLLRVPFFILALCGIDIYYEVQVVVVLYLVLPRTLGIHRLRGHLTSCLGSLLARLSMAAPAPFRTTSAEDGPGTYQLLCAAAVTSSFVPGPKTIVQQLAPNDVVRVLEVVPDETGTKLRARIEEPAGWITLVNRETGKRWATAYEGVPTPSRAALQDGVMAAAAAAGLDPATILSGGGLGAVGGGAGQQAGPVSPEEAWEAMALLESQLARGDDASEEPGARRAAQMLRTMLTTLVQSGNPTMLTMAQTMMPDIGNI
jgi:hypothetical protein